MRDNSMAYIAHYCAIRRAKLICIGVSEFVKNKNAEKLVFLNFDAKTK
jgi:hypothetical protein